MAKTFIRPDVLQALIVNDPTAARVARTVPANAVAVLMALVKVESNFQVNAQGTEGTVTTSDDAFGLWQMNVRVHTFDKVKILGDVAYAIQIAADLLDKVDGSIRRGISALRERVEAGEEITMNTGRDLPQWFNIGWQFGGGHLFFFLANTTDTSTDGFKAWRKSIGRPLSIKLNWDNPLLPKGRIQKFWSEYTRVDTGEGPSFTQEVIGGTAEDLRALADYGFGSGGLVDDAKKFFGDLADAPGKAVAGAAGAAANEVADTLKGLWKEVRWVFFVGLGVLLLAMVSLVLFLTKSERALITSSVARSQ